MFKGQIAHGMLSAAFFSTILGTQLPGPGCIYLGQNLRFRAPVRPGDRVKAAATITKIEKNRVHLDCSASVGDTVVVDGEAVVLVPSRADTD
jgi:3-hydroxybutyryl-CoA dehydratase